MSVNKLERLLNLTAVLLNTTRPLAAEELRQKVEGYPPPGAAFHRAFERDKDDLRVLGIPLRVERVPATDPPVDGYRIAPDDYYLPDPGLDADELAALHLASLAVRVDGFGPQEALWKLGGMAVDESEPGGAGGDATVVMDQLASIPTDPALIPIFKAITDRMTVEFDYRGARRTLDPWRLDFHRGRWYVTGFDHLREGERNFRLDRMDGPVEVTDSTFERPARPQAGPGPRRAWEMGADEPVEARLLVDESRVATALKQLGEDIAAEPQPDGSVIFTVPVVKHDAFQSFVLGFLEHAELLEPLEWRDRIRQWLAAMADGVPADTAGAAEAGA